jgi:protease-4
MGTVAASGGYYVAAAGKEIYALPLTVTGSIGVFYGKADVSGLLGSSASTSRPTRRRRAPTPSRSSVPSPPRSARELEHKVEQFYDTFLDRVAQGRHMKTSDVDAVGQGRVWVGQQAIEKGLVDKLGGLREAIEEAELLGGLASDAPIAEYPVVDRSLLEIVLGLGLESRTFAIDGLPVQIKDAVRAVAPMAVYTQDVPMARMEWVSLGAD